MDIELISLRKEHLEKVRLWRNLEEVSKYMYSSPNISEAEQKEWFDQINDETDLYWVINFQGRDLGLASINNIDRKNLRATWAFYLGDTTVRGIGLGSKVEYKVLSYAFSVLNLNKLCCEVLTANPRVVVMHEKFGFRREGLLRQHILKEKSFLDVVILAITKEEWERVREYHKKRIYGEVD